MANPVECTPVGVVASASWLPVAEAYSAGDTVSTAQALSWTFTHSRVAVPAGSTLRILTSELKIDATAVISGETSYTLHLYSRTPPSAQANNATWSLASADLPYYLGSLALGTVVDLGAAVYVKTGGHDLDIALETNVISIYGSLVTVGAATLAAVARQVALRGMLI
jgi:hypothetical protein